MGASAGQHPPTTDRASTLRSTLEQRTSWSSSARTCSRIASIDDRLPSCFQLCHLAFSTMFQPHGLGCVQGPSVACWCSA